jgi:integrase
MAKVRGAREGSIYQRKSDGRWVAACTVDGKQKYLYARTKEEARQKLREMQRRQELGQPVLLKHQKVAQFLEKWLEEVAKPSVRPRTYASYAQMVRLHIKPALGHYRLDQIAPQHVQAFLKNKSETKSRRGAGKLSPRTVNYLRDILRQALNPAIKWDLITRNVAELATPLRDERREARKLTPEQCIALLEAARGERLGALYAVALSTGIRQGEGAWVAMERRGPG